MEIIELNKNHSEIIHYNYKNIPVYFHKGHFSSYPFFTMTVHWHEDFELILILKGELTYIVNGKLINLKEGEGIFINSGRSHSAFMNKQTECEYYVVLFHPVLLPGANNLKKPIEDYVHLTSKQTWQKEVINYIECISKTFNEPTSEFSAVGALCFIWELFAIHLSSSFKTISYNSFDTLKKMIIFIYENYTEKIYLADVALAGCVSKRTCEHLFNRYIHRTPIEFINSYRLTRSIELLKNTNLPITEIALTCGFSSPNYYAETFRKHMYISPKEYRINLSDKGNK